MSRLPILTSAALAALGTAMLAGSAAAQTSGQTSGQTPGQASGLRHLSWQGRAEASRPAPQPVSAPVAARAGRRPNPVIPHGGMAAATPPRPGLTPAPGGTPGRLTPANAWMRPAAVVEAAPVATPVAAPPAPATMAEAAPAPTWAPAPPPPSRALPDFLPDQGGQPAPSAVIQPPQPEYSPAPPSVPDADADPMAPRRDAPIFRMQQDAPQPAAVVQETAEVAAPPRATRPESIRQEPTRQQPTMTVARNTADRPPSQGARYYSVHRQNGQQPDAMVMPEPTYVDALTLTLPETPASQDLAQPDQGPTLIRDNQGRMRAAPAASDGDHQ